MKAVCSNTHRAASCRRGASLAKAGLLGLALCLAGTANAANYTWDASGTTAGISQGDGTWSTSASGTYWVSSGTSTAWVSAIGNFAYIGTGSDLGGNYTITSATVSTGGIFFNYTGTNAYTLTTGVIVLPTQAISASGTITNATAGTKVYIGSVLSGSNLNINNGTTLGTIVLTASNALTGTYSVKSGALQLGNGGTTGRVSSAVAGNISIAAGASLIINRSNVAASGTDFSGISGFGNFVQAGTGTTVFAVTRSQTYTGTTFIDNGVLQLGDGVTTGGTFGGTGPIVNNSTLVLNKVGSLVLSGDVSGTGNILMMGGGLNGFTGDMTSFTGTTTVLSGTFYAGGQMNSPIVLSTGSSAVHISGEQVLGPIQNTGNGVIDFVTGGAQSASISGGGSIRISGDTQLTGSSSFTGTVSLNGGGLTIGNGTTSGWIDASTFRFVGNDYMVAFNRSDDVASSAFFDGTINAIGGSILKLGSGNLTLTGSMSTLGASYRAVTIGDGTLTVNGLFPGFATFTQDRTSAATLAGTGTIGLIYATGSSDLAFGGKVSPGVPGGNPGILTTPGILTDIFAPQQEQEAFTFQFQFTGTGAPDWSSPSSSKNDVLRLTDAGNYFPSFDSRTVFNIYFSSAFANTATYQGGLFTDLNDGFEDYVANATFRYYVLDDVSGTVAFDGHMYSTLTQAVTRTTVQVETANFSGGTVNGGYTMQFVVVPEPGTLALAATGILGGLWTARRRLLKR